MRHRRYASPGARGAVLLALALLGLAPLAASGAPPDDAYIAGYVAAVLERQLNVNPRSLQVKDGVVSLDAADVPRADRPKLITALSAIQGVTRVEVREGLLQAPPAPAAAAPSPPAPEPPAVGFLPTGHLFRPLIADPRWPHFSAAYRHYITTPGSKDLAAVSFGETVPLYRGNLGEGARRGQWETGVQGGVFSIFDLDSDSFDLVNTDFFIAAFAGYRVGDFSAFGRL